MITPLYRRYMKQKVDIFLQNGHDLHKINDTYENVINIGVEKDFATYFAQKVHPHIAFDHKLYIFDHDWNSTDKNTGTEDIQELLKSPYLLHVYYEDPDQQGIPTDRSTFMPMGLETRTLENFDHYQKVVQDSLPTQNRIPRACITFGGNHVRSAGDHIQNRNLAHQSAMRPGSGIDILPRMQQLEYMQRISEYAFALSPFGHGLDCHRTWEILLMRSIPIVQTSQLDPLFKDMPVVIVQNWDEITEDKLRSWLPIYAKKFQAPHPQIEPYLTVEYWLSK